GLWDGSRFGQGAAHPGAPGMIEPAVAAARGSRRATRPAEAHARHSYRSGWRVCTRPNSHVRVDSTTPRVVGQGQGQGSTIFAQATESTGDPSARGAGMPTAKPPRRSRPLRCEEPEHLVFVTTRPL